ncbi:MAG TPA: hypothetical protein VHA11_06805, partial [Bryobacteraceae bacterium]|nr:hypothetical protein [Bryobacteraceae bacterium]
KWPTINEDFTFFKRFSFAERINATLRLDAFNAFNRHGYDGWDETVTSPTFGRATSGFGSRTCQGSLRLSF